VTVPTEAGEGEITEAALSHPKVVEILQGKAPRRVVVVPGSLVNIIP